MDDHVGARGEWSGTEGETTHPTTPHGPSVRRTGTFRRPFLVTDHAPTRHAYVSFRKHNGFI